MYDVYENVKSLCKQCVAESTAGLREDPDDRDPAEDPVHRQGDDAGRSRSVSVSLLAFTALAFDCSCLFNSFALTLT